MTAVAGAGRAGRRAWRSIEASIRSAAPQSLHSTPSSRVTTQRSATRSSTSREKFATGMPR